MDKEKEMIVDVWLSMPRLDEDQRKKVLSALPPAQFGIPGYEPPLYSGVEWWRTPEWSWLPDWLLEKGPGLPPDTRDMSREDAREAMLAWGRKLSRFADEWEGGALKSANIPGLLLAGARRGGLGYEFKFDGQKEMPDNIWFAGKLSENNNDAKKLMVGAEGLGAVVMAALEDVTPCKKVFLHTSVETDDMIFSREMKISAAGIDAGPMKETKRVDPDVSGLEMTFEAASKDKLMNHGRLDFGRRRTWKAHVTDKETGKTAVFTFEGPAGATENELPRIMFRELDAMAADWGCAFDEWCDNNLDFVPDEGGDAWEGAQADYRRVEKNFEGIETLFGGIEGFCEFLGKPYEEMDSAPIYR